jgi:hypothetical protein
VCPGYLIADVRAVVQDAYDGAARFLGDSQRLGLQLYGFSIAANLENGGARLMLRVGLPAHLDQRQLLNRLHRHPTVIEVDMLPPRGSGHVEVIPKANRTTLVFSDEQP